MHANHYNYHRLIKAGYLGRGSFLLLTGPGLSHLKDLFSSDLKKKYR